MAPLEQQAGGGAPKKRPPACPFRPTGSRCEPQPVRAGPASGVNGLGLTQLGFDPAGPVQRHRGMVAGHSGIGAACVRADCWCPGSGGATGSGQGWARGSNTCPMSNRSRPAGAWGNPGPPLGAWSPPERQGRRRCSWTPARRPCHFRRALGDAPDPGLPGPS